MSRPEVFQKLNDWQLHRRTLGAREPNKTIGFVPTMGALHKGHRSLLERARRENDYVVLSIFVNPTQFNNPNDFAKYPITLDADLKMAEEVGVDFVILPTREDIYPDEYRYRVVETTLSKSLCGAHRPGHFDGVLTIVMKLFGLVKPQRAYFGQKDYQPLELIRGMTESFYMDLEIVPCPTLRESDGLAMSSRNLRLTSDQRQTAPQIARLLKRSLLEGLPTDWVKTQLSQSGFLVDYVEDVSVGQPASSRRFVAASLGEIRLIDNLCLSEAKDLEV